MDVLTERVRRGARYLDLARPDWVERIRVEELDMGFCTRCILGQLFGNFLRVVNEISKIDGPDVARRWAVEHGFNFGADDPQKPNKSGSIDYEPLTSRWLAEIAARREVLAVVLEPEPALV